MAAAAGSVLRMQGCAGTGVMSCLTLGRCCPGLCWWECTGGARCSACKHGAGGRMLAHLSIAGSPGVQVCATLQPCATPQLRHWLAAVPQATPDSSPHHRSVSGCRTWSRRPCRPANSMFALLLSPGDQQQRPLAHVVDLQVFCTLQYLERLGVSHEINDSTCNIVYMALAPQHVCVRSIPRSATLCGRLVQQLHSKVSAAPVPPPTLRHIEQ